MIQKLEFDLIAPEVLRDPYPTLARMRDDAPIYRVQHREFSGHPWVLTRYDDVLALLNDTRFTKDVMRIPGVLEARQAAGANAPAASPISRHLLTLDPPDHTRLRALIHKAFTPNMIRAFTGRVEAITHALLDAMLPKKQFDFLEDFAVPLPVTVIAELLGVPQSDQAKFREWTQAIVLGGSATGDPQKVGLAVRDFVIYFQQKFAERRADPQDDLITGLVQAEEAGDKLDQQELISMVFLLLVAGHETTVNLLANGLLALVQHREHFRLLRDQPDVAKTAVDELLRFDGPIGVSTMRWALEPVEYYGQVIQAGEMVVGSLLAADRDPAMFADPDTLDLTRSPNKHLAFGNGIHYCVGAPLARLEGAIAFNILAERAPDIALDTPLDALDWNKTILLHGMTALPMHA